MHQSGTRPAAVLSGALAVALIGPAIVLTAPHRDAAQATVSSKPTAAQAPATRASDKIVNAQILGINDFHGHLEPDTLSISAKTGTDHGPGYLRAGGAAYLAAKVRAAKKKNPATVVVSAGDLIGASPMISGYYHDESTIEAMNKILDVGAVGNHEFDEGTAELLRMVHGGCHPVDGCQDHTGFAGAKFPMLAANVIVRSTGLPLLQPYVIKDVGGAKIAFIGVVTTDTPAIVPAAGIATVQFTDEAATVNALVPQVRAAGADAVVVLIHDGAAQAPDSGINSCDHLSGSAADFTRAVSGVDAVLSAHTHKAYTCVINGIPLTSAASYGRVMTAMQLKIDVTNHTVQKVSAKNSIVTHTIAPAADVAKIIARYHRLIAPIADRKEGKLTKAATRGATRTGESSIGDLVADAQLWNTKAKKNGGAQLAIVNRGVLRTDLPKGQVRYRDIYAVQPFGHRLVTVTLTGRQLAAALEQQFCDSFATSNDRHVPLNVSTGFSYRYDDALPCGHKIRLADIKLHGKAIKATNTYRVTMNEYLAAGGDGIKGMTVGASLHVGILDRDAVAKYLRAKKSLNPPHRTRVTLR